MEHLDPDQLVLLALGEWTSADGAAASSADPATPSADDPPNAHLLGCPTCREELAQLERTVGLAREAGELGLQADVVLPPSIWSGIAQELGIGSSLVHDRPSTVGGQASAPGRESTDDRPGLPIDRLRLGVAPADARDLEGSRRPGHRAASRTARVARRVAIRRGLLVAAVVIAVGIGIGTGLAINRPDTPSAAVQSQAQLAPVGSGPSDAHGTAVVTQGSGGLSLHVKASQLPLRQGYYEVWLYNPKADQMVAVGTLGAGGDGAFTLASSIDLQAYSVVNVSAQDFDGNPAHKTSMLQGPLTQ